MAARSQDEAESPAAPSPRGELPGERQAAWIMSKMEEIQEDPDMVLDARDLLSNMPGGAQKYLAYLLREGPKSHADARVFFKATEAAIEKAAREVVDTLKQILDDA